MFTNEVQGPHVLPRFTPHPQKTRSRSLCECGGPCFYCGEALPGRHDHDHFPVPWRHGGRVTVPACKRCHLLKDSNRNLSRWAPAALTSVEQGLEELPPATVGIIALYLEGGADEIEGPDELAPAIVSYVETATTPEARIALASMFAFMLDIAKSRAAEAA